MKKKSKKRKIVTTISITFLICLIAAFMVLHSSPQLAIRTHVFQMIISSLPSSSHKLYTVKSAFMSKYEYEKNATTRSPLVELPTGKGTIYSFHAVGGTGTGFCLVEKRGFLYFAKYLGGE